MNKIIKEISRIVLLFGVIILSSGTTSFALVVLSGSMEPELNAGDIVLAYGSLINTLEPKEGDVVIYKLANSTMEIPIVHRVISTKTSPDGLLILTKGDANSVDDKPIWKEYGKTKEWLEINEVKSIMYAKIPKVGMPLVWLHNTFGSKWRWLFMAYVIADTVRSWFKLTYCLIK